MQQVWAGPRPSMWAESRQEMPRGVAETVTGPGLVRSACSRTLFASSPCETGASSRSGCPSSCLCCCSTTVGPSFRAAPLHTESWRASWGRWGPEQGAGRSASTWPEDVAPGLAGAGTPPQPPAWRTWLRVGAQLSAPVPCPRKRFLPELQLAGADGALQSSPEHELGEARERVPGPSPREGTSFPWASPPGQGQVRAPTVCLTLNTDAYLSLQELQDQDPAYLV